MENKIQSCKYRLINKKMVNMNFIFLCNRVNFNSIFVVEEVYICVFYVE